MVEEVNLFRERKTGKSKACGFVTMQTRDQALKAIETMAGEPEVSLHPDIRACPAPAPRSTIRGLDKSMLPKY